MQRRLSTRAARNWLVGLGLVGLLAMAWMAWDMGRFLSRAEEHRATVVSRERRRLRTSRIGHSEIHELIVDLAGEADAGSRRVTATVSAAVYERSPAGTVVAVLVDPEDAEDVRVDPDPSGPLLMMGLCALVLLGGGVCHLLVLRERRQGESV